MLHTPIIRSLVGIVVATTFVVNTASALDSIDENCMSPIDVIVQQSGPSNGQSPSSGLVSLELIEQAYGEETRQQAEVWAAEGHGFFQSLYWGCIGHVRQWSRDGHARSVSRNWNNTGHQYGWTTDGHTTSVSGSWTQDGHQYQWTRDGHSTNVSQNWEGIDHPYALTRSNTGHRPSGLAGAGSWYEYQAFSGAE